MIYSRSLYIICLALLSSCVTPEPEDWRVLTYNKYRDLHSLQQQFQKERYWLTFDPQFSLQQFLDPHPGRKTWVIRRKKSLGGFITFSQAQDKSHGKIHLILVIKTFRGQGLAARLMNKALKDLQNKQISKVKLATRSHNIIAQRFFAGFGFRPTYNDMRLMTMELNFPELSSYHSLGPNNVVTVE